MNSTFGMRGRTVGAFLDVCVSVCFCVFRRSLEVPGGLRKVVDSIGGCTLAIATRFLRRTSSDFVVSYVLLFLIVLIVFCICPEAPEVTRGIRIVSDSTGSDSMRGSSGGLKEKRKNNQRIDRVPD